MDVIVFINLNINLSLLKNVSSSVLLAIPCGHSYCMSCIQSFWDKKGKKKHHSCPQCRQTFAPRPALVKNTMLAALVEQLKLTGLQAVRSCLNCLVFCLTDQQCICILCTMDEHKGHETAPAAAERAKRQKELEENRQQIQKKIEDQEKELKRLQQEVKDACVSADEAVKSTEKIFTELITLLQKRRSEVKQQIRSQQEAQVLRVKEVQEKLEQELNDLKRRDTELEKLSHTEDHNQFLQSYASLSAPSDLADSSDKLQDILRDVETHTLQTVSSSRPEPKSRAEFLKYACEISLDPNTAFRTLKLSNENRAAIVWYEDESFTPSPERFSSCRQVLSRQSLTGRCYFEFKWAGIGIFVAVAYKSTKRGGRANESLFGFNDQSWALRCDIEHLSWKGAGYTFSHNKAETPVSSPQSYKLGVYLDHSAGVLAFYDVSETMTLLHRVQTTFTQPLYAGLGFFFCDGGDAEFCNLKDTE
uniref:Tripartite motif-containing protein 16-like n=1 Tax=Poecilia latipinna TaxID=48699 RepID=A0A3B3TW59_9TELE